MPPYPGNNLANMLQNNRAPYLWENEIIPAGATTGSMSRAFQVWKVNQSFYPYGISFEAWFASDPGAFEIDILGANQDIGYPNPGHYVQLGSITTVNSSFVGRWDMATNMWPKYVAVYMKTLTNAVAVTLQVTK